MKKIFSVVSLAGIGCALLTLANVQFSAIPAPDPIPAQAAPALPFAAFPVGEPREIEFDYEKHTAELFTRRERRDQALDWMLLAVLSDAGLSPQRLNEATFDLPPSRHGFFRPVATFEYGATRSRFVGEGKVVALIPEGTSPQQADHLAQVFDEHRKNVGEAPAAVLVFEYSLDTDAKAARITRRDEVSDKDLQGKSHGYVEAEVGSVAELKRFLAQSDDVVYAAVREGKLLLGGRKILGRPMLGATVDDVAALWQAERRQAERVKAFEARWNPEFDALNARWRSRTYRFESERMLLEKERDGEFAALQERAHADRVKLGVIDHSGFSLDPTFDYEKLALYFMRIEGMLRKHAADPGAAIAQRDIDAARNGLALRSEKALFEMLYKMKTGAHPLSQFFVGLFQEDLRDSQFQAARYDGDLAGTEVGMTLFYTDLLAKLWALDYQGSAPARQVEDFLSMTAQRLSPVFHEEQRQLSSTRLWFGHQDNGFQIAADRNSLAFARIAARVFAASSESLRPGVETEAAAGSEAFLGWWNDHYQEVALYEPQYDRLNQIMKWSLLIGWLNASGRGELLGKLETVKVKRSNWFPEWVREHKELKFKHWANVGFFPRNHKGAKTEAMPILYSRPYPAMGAERILSGGVSLAPKQLLKERHALSSQTSAVLRRSSIDYKNMVSGGELRALSGARYQLSAAGQRADLTAKAKTGAKMRTRTGELASGNFQRAMFRDHSGFNVEASAGGQPIGNLKIVRTRNGFDIGWRGRQLDSGHSLAQRVSRSRNLEQALLADGEVDVMVRLAGKERFAVKLRESESWLLLSPEEAPSVSIAKGVDARVSDPQTGVRNIELASVKDPAALLSGAKPEGFLVADAGSPGGKLVLRLEARGPPPGSQKVVHEGNVPSWSDGKKLYFTVADLQAVGTQGDAVGLAARAARIQTKQIQVPLSPREESAVVRGLRGNEYREVARTLAAEPKLAAKELTEHLKLGLTASDGLAAEGRHAAAIERLDRLIEVHGPLPEITLRKGIAQIEAGKPRRAAEALQASAGRPLRDRNAFFDEINARLKRADLRPAERENLSRLAEYAEMHDLQHRKVIEGSVTSAPNGDQLAVHYKAGQPLGGKPLADAERAGINPKVDTIYIQDRPGLNNLDWGISLGHALREMPAGQVSVLRLQNVAIGHFRPDVVFSPDGAVKLHHLGKVKPVPRSHGSYERANDRCQNPSQPECQEERRRQNVYVVLMKR